MGGPTLCVVRGWWPLSLFVEYFVFYKERFYFDSDSGYFGTQFPARYALGTSFHALYDYLHSETVFQVYKQLGMPNILLYRQNSQNLVTRTEH